MSGKIWSWLGGGSFIASAVLLAGMLPFVGAGLPQLATAAVIVLLLFGLYAHRVSRRCREAELSAAERRRSVQMLSRYRHDWMNDLQVLFGYIQLNKPDQVKTHIASIADKLHREGLVAKLGILELTDYLIHFRTDTQKMELIVRPEREISLAAIGETGKRAADLLIALIQAFHDAAHGGEGEAGQLAVTIDLMERELLLLFEYSGKYSESALRRRCDAELAKLEASGRAVCEFREETADVEVRLAMNEGGDG